MNISSLSNVGFFEKLKQLLGFQSEGDRLALNEISLLVKKLSELPQVSEIRVFAPQSNNPYELIFEVRSSAEFSQREDVLCLAVDMVIDCQWYLYKITNNEDWLFSVRIVTTFASLDTNSSLVLPVYVRPKQLQCLSAAG